MFGDVVLGIDHDDFEHELSSIKKAAGAKFDIELTAAHLKELVTKYKVGMAAVGVGVVFGWGCYQGMGAAHLKELVTKYKVRCPCG
jgi:hypothetical protein